MQHTQGALKLYAQLPEGHYQFAKLNCHVGEVDRGIHSLGQAIELDPLYSVKCFSDDDFVRHEPQVVKLITTMRDDRLKWTARECGRARQVAMQLKTESRHVSAEWRTDSSVCCINSRLDLCSQGCRILRGGLRFVNKAGNYDRWCGQPVPYLDALKVFENGAHDSVGVATVADASRSELEAELRRDRSHVPAPTMALVKMPTYEEEAKAKSLPNYISSIWGTGFLLIGFLFAFIGATIGAASGPKSSGRGDIDGLYDAFGFLGWLVGDARWNCLGLDRVLDTKQQTRKASF